MLSISDKILLIKEIARRLGWEEWSLIDLTLKMYSLPTSESWRGDRESYVMKMIEDGSEIVLKELGKHLGFAPDEGQPHNVEPAFWRKSHLKMFISHLAAHKVQASELSKFLNKLGISCFVAHDDIEPTLEWQSQIELALSTCDVLLVLLQPNFHESKWTDQEIGFAMGRGIPILAIRLGLDPYGFIGRFQAFNGNGKTNFDLSSDIFVACCAHKQSRSIMANSLVTVFENSNSFADASRNIELLEKYAEGNKFLAEKILAALNTNSQISGSFGVKRRCELLAKKWKESA